MFVIKGVLFHHQMWFMFFHRTSKIACSFSTYVRSINRRKHRHVFSYRLCLQCCCYFASIFVVFSILADSMLLLPVILLFVFVALLTSYFFLLQQRYQYFNQRGIPTPPFQYFFGHVRKLWSVASYHRQLENWTKQYGKIYGLCEGAVPIFVVSDPDFLQEVFVKQFSVFSARKANLLDNVTSDLFSTSGQKWRRQRHLINPTFTASKLKTMSPLYQWMYQ